MSRYRIREHRFLPVKTFSNKSFSGFTLIELVVVLAVMAVMAHLAVIQVSHLRQSKLRKAAERQFDELSRAVYSPGLAGEPASGFLVDMGRLPRALPIDPDRSDSPLSLRELWERPDDVAPYAVRRATRENLARGVDGALADASVFVPCGWRGPYIHLPVHGTRLLDPWGNAFETPDDAHFSRLTDISTNSLSAGDAVELVRHFGSDGQPDGEADETVSENSDGALCLIPSGGVASRLFVMTSFVRSDGVESARDGTTVTVRWYAPCGGTITGGIARATTPAPGVVDSIPPGDRFIRVSTLTQTGMVKRVSLLPGDNLHFEKFPAR